MVNGSFALLANQSIIIYSDEHLSAVTTWFIIMILVSLAGDFANFFLLKAIAANSVLRKRAGILVIHAIVLQMVTTGVGTPLYATMFYGDMVWNWHIPDWSCKYWFVLFAACLYGRNWANLILAVNRFVAVCAPFQYKRFTTKPAIFAKIAVVWVTCGVIVLLPAFGITGVYAVGQSGACTYVQHRNTKGGGYRLAFAVYVPLAVTAVLYSLIAWNLMWKKKARSIVAHSYNGGGSKMGKSRHMGLVRSLLITYLWLLATYLPGNIMASFFPHAAPSKIFFVWLRTVSLWAPALDPVILIAANKPYRQACYRLLWNKGQTVGPFTGVAYIESKPREATLRRASSIILFKRHRLDQGF